MLQGERLWSWGGEGKENEQDQRDTVSDSGHRRHRYAVDLDRGGSERAEHGGCVSERVRALLIGSFETCKSSLQVAKVAGQHAELETHRVECGWYTSGEGVPQGDAEAAKWWRKAAEQGNAGAQQSLGSQDYPEAVRWYGLAAEQGDAAVPK